MQARSSTDHRVLAGWIQPRSGGAVAVNAAVAADVRGFLRAGKGPRDLEKLSCIFLCPTLFMEFHVELQHLLIRHGRQIGVDSR